MAPTPARARAGKPADVALNLDSLEREDAKPEFAVVVSGKRLVFEDAANLEWDVLADMDSPEDFVEKCLGDEDRATLYAAHLPGWKFKALYEAYQAHYGLGSPGNARG